MEPVATSLPLQDAVEGVLASRDNQFLRKQREETRVQVPVWAVLGGLIGGGVVCAAWALGFLNTKRSLGQNLLALLAGNATEIIQAGSGFVKNATDFLEVKRAVVDRAAEERERRLAEQRSLERKHELEMKKYDAETELQKLRMQSAELVERMKTHRAVKVEEIKTTRAGIDPAVEEQRQARLAKKEEEDRLSTQRDLMIRKQKFKEEHGYPMPEDEEDELFRQLNIGQTGFPKKRTTRKSLVKIDTELLKEQEHQMTVEEVANDGDQEP